jgi:hypothetical protein
METRHWLRTLLVGGASLMALGAWAFIDARPEGATTASMRVAGSARASLLSSGTQDTAPAIYYASLSANASQLIASALAPSAAGADPLQVEPRVPRASGSPCVVTLFRDMPIPVMSIYDPNFSYTPPSACPGPWAKVKLIVQLSGPRQNGLPTSAVSLAFIEGRTSAGRSGRARRRSPPTFRRGCWNATSPNTRRC